MLKLAKTMHRNLLVMPYKSPIEPIGHVYTYSKIHKKYTKRAFLDTLAGYLSVLIGPDRTWTKPRVFSTMGCRFWALFDAF